MCNLCAVEGHKSANCPNKDRCRRCHETGHFARNCPNPWNSSDVQVHYSDDAQFPPLRDPAAGSAHPDPASVEEVAVGSAPLFTESSAVEEEYVEPQGGVASMEDGQFESVSDDPGGQVVDSGGYLVAAQIVAEGHVSSDPNVGGYVRVYAQNDGESNVTVVNNEESDINESNESYVNNEVNNDGSTLNNVRLWIAGVIWLPPKL